MGQVKRLGKSKLFVVINVAIIILIALFLIKKFYASTLEFDLGYDRVPGKLIEFVADNFHDKYDLNELSVVFIFNEVPWKTDIESINKLYQKHHKDVRFFVFFQGAFQKPFDFGFPHKFMTGVKIVSQYDGKRFTEKYVVLLDQKKVKHVQAPMKAVDLNFLIEKHLHPEKGYESYAISTDDLKSKVIKRLLRGNAMFFNLTGNDYAIFEFPGDFTEIFVITADCSSCELKNIVSDLKLKQLLDNRNILVVFPVFANESELSDVIKKESINIPIYIDLKDQLGLFSILTNSKDHYIKIARSELIQPEVEAIQAEEKEESR